MTPQDLANYAAAIRAVESSGNYRALGPVTKGGDRAYGAYQVMGNNVPEWTKMALGKSMTPDEFLGDNAAQDAVFNHHFGSSVNQYGNPHDAASIWFTGQPMSGKNASDGYIDRNEYVKRFSAALAANQNPQAAPAQDTSQDSAVLPSNARPTGFQGGGGGSPGDMLGSLGTGLQEAAAGLMSINNPGAGALMLSAVQSKKNANKLQMGVIGQDEIGNNIYGAFNPTTGQATPLSALMGAQGASIAGQGTGFGTNGLSDGLQKVRDAVAAGANPTEALKNAPDSVSAIAKAIMEGREPPAQFARNANAMKAATLYAFAADPNLDATKIEERKTFAKSMGSIAPNSYGGEVKMSGTVVQHLATALDQAKAIFGSDFGPGDVGPEWFQKARLGVGNMLGDPAIKTNMASYQSTIQSLSSELEKLLTNGRPTEGAIRERIKGLDLANGPQSVYNALSNVQNLMQGRLDNVAAAKARAYGGDADPRGILPPEIQGNYDRVINNASSYNTQRAADKAAPSGGGIPDGATATNPKTGAKLVRQGGQWVPAQ